MKKIFIGFIPVAIIGAFISALTLQAQTGKEALKTIEDLNLVSEESSELKDAFRVGIASAAAEQRTVNHVTRNTVISNTNVSHVTRNTVISNTNVNHITRNTVISNTNVNHVTRNTVISNTNVSHVTRNTVISNFRNGFGVLKQSHLPQPRISSSLN